MLTKMFLKKNITQSLVALLLLIEMVI